MNRFWVRALTATAAAIAISAAAPACAHNDQTLFIQGVLAAPTQRGAGGQCDFVANTVPELIASGTFDVGLASQYSIEMQLGNQMLSRGAANSGDPVRAETSRIIVDGAEVRIDDVQGNTIANFTTLGSAFVDIGTGAVEGLGVLGVVGIDSATTKANFCSIMDDTTRVQVVLTIKAFGKTLGGTDIESNEFQFPVTICKGCLVDKSDNCDPLSMVTPLSPPCENGVDTSILCRSCANSRPAVCVKTPDPTLFAQACAAQ